MPELPLTDFAVEGLMWLLKRKMEKDSEVSVATKRQDRINAVLSEWVRKQEDKSSCPVPAPEPCPYCSLHDHLAIAMSLARGITIQSDSPDAPLKEGLGGTIPLIRDHLQDATRIVMTLPSSIPAAQDLIITIKNEIQAVASKLGMVKSVQEVQEWYPHIEAAWIASHEMARRFFTDKCSHGVCEVPPAFREKPKPLPEAT